jgi:hypothetical protein
MHGRRLFGSLVLAVLALGASVGGEIVVGPLTIELPVAPAQTASGAFHVRNSGEKAEEVRVSAFGYSLYPDGGLNLEAPARSLAPLLEIFPAQFALAPGESTTVTLRFQAPEEPGDHWAILFVEGSEATPVVETSGEISAAVQVKVRYGVKLIQRDPSAARAGEITDMTVVSNDPIRVLVRFANTGGSVLRKATGRVEVRGVTGEVLVTVDLPEFTVLPGAWRDLTIDLPVEDLPRPGDYLALCLIDFGGDYLVAGELELSLR